MRTQTERLDLLLDMVDEIKFQASKAARFEGVLKIVSIGLCSRCELTTSPERDCVHNLARSVLEAYRDPDAEKDASNG